MLNLQETFVDDGLGLGGGGGGNCPCLSFVLTEIEVKFHTGRIISKACLPFIILALMCSFVPPDD